MFCADGVCTFFDPADEPDGLVLYEGSWCEQYSDFLSFIMGGEP